MYYNRFRVFVICGPSGVGKGTIISRLMSDYPNKFGFSVSHTTRPPRVGEQNGKDYHFVSKDFFKGMLENNRFLEYADVYDKMYGTSFEAVKNVLDDNKCCILDLDIQGTKSVRKSTLDPVCIFIKPPTIQSLEDRLLARHTETIDEIRNRMVKAEAIITEAEVTKDLFDEVIINDDLDACYSKFVEVIKKYQPNFL
ncbi:guanylate kinase [Acrasis kona]|uniref:guanylate kinase n=2 Tax=Acrasis kona TaxID=1008807 RepID=A0AAW2YGT2_9EUKA